MVVFVRSKALEANAYLRGHPSVCSSLSLLGSVIKILSTTNITYLSMKRRNITMCNTLSLGYEITMSCIYNSHIYSRTAVLY